MAESQPNPFVFLACIFRELDFKLATFAVNLRGHKSQFIAKVQLHQDPFQCRGFRCGKWPHQLGAFQADLTFLFGTELADPDDSAARGI